MAEERLRTSLREAEGRWPQPRLELVVVTEADRGDPGWWTLLTRSLPSGLGITRWRPQRLARSDAISVGGNAFLIDGDLAEERALNLVTQLVEADPHRPVILLMPEGREELAIEAFRRGVSDCLARDRLTAGALQRSLTNSLERAAMRRQLEIRDLLLDSIDEGVITVNRSREITTVNHAASRQLGADPEEIVGRRCCEVLGASACRGTCAFRPAVDEGQVSQERAVRGRNLRKDDVVWSVKSSPLRDGGGGVTGGLVVLRDLREAQTSGHGAGASHTLEGMVSRSPIMQELFAQLPAIARSESTVLVEGPSGSGKELVARALHNLSPRRQGPFVAVNCAALPDTLLESELFGYRAGAFTGATEDRPGRFAAAEGGTLFLDEIGDISPQLQTRLLRVLEAKTFEPLGSIDSVKANVRVVAATNQNLEAAMQAGWFRQDLYFRLRVLHVTLPPLTDRAEDIPILAEHFLEEVCRAQGKIVHGFHQRVLVKLKEHDYPGNVRELRNIVEHAVALCDQELIDLQHLPGYLNAVLRGTGGPKVPGSSLDHLERTYIEELLRKHRGNRSAVARALGIHLSTLYRKCDRLDIQLPSQDGRHRT